MNAVLANAWFAVLATILIAADPTPKPGICSFDTFSIDGRSVGVSLCFDEAAVRRSSDGRRVIVTVAETLSASREASFSRDVTLDFLARAEESRTIDDVPLGKLGIERTLHLTIAYRPGSIRLEHALLVPGAIPLK